MSGLGLFFKAALEKPGSVESKALHEMLGMAEQPKETPTQLASPERSYMCDALTAYGRANRHLRSECATASAQFKTDDSRLSQDQLKLIQAAVNFYSSTEAGKTA